MRKVMKLDKNVTTSFKPVANHMMNINYDKQKKVRVTEFL